MLPPTLRLYGNVYKAWLRFLRESENYSNDQIADYQVKKLRETCINAYNNVPYYRGIFDDAGLDPEAIKYPDQIDVLPFLTKQMVQENTDMLISKKFKKSNLRFSSTSGSTGMPLVIYVTPSLSRKEGAFIFYMRDLAGFRMQKKTAVVRGGYRGEDGPIVKQYGQLLLSALHMSNENMRKFIEEMRKFGVQDIQAFPSAAYMLAHLMIEEKIEPFDSLKYIWLGSENVHDYMRKTIERAFCCPIGSHYGHAEQACLAFQCRHSQDYHVFWQYGYAELINNEGFHANGEGERGEIVATSFDHEAMPLIRYRTQDVAHRTQRKCEAHPQYQCWSKIEGRLQDVLIARDGQYIPDVFNEHLPIFGHVRHFQFYQDTPGLCFFRIARGKDYSGVDEQIISGELKTRLGPNLDFKIEYVNEIPSNRMGKRPMVIQKLPVIFEGKG